MKIISAALLALVAISKAHAGILISDPYIRATPPVVPNSAAFMRLSNDGETPVFVTSAQTPAATISEIHGHKNVNGVMSMYLVEALEIPASGTVLLQPGGLHLMLFGLKQPLKPGMVIPMALNFSDGTSQNIRIPVVKTSLGK